MDKKRKLLDALAPLEMPFEKKQDFVNILLSGNNSSTDNDDGDVKYIISFYDGTSCHTFIDENNKAIYSKDSNNNDLFITYDDIKKDNVYNMPCAPWDAGSMDIIITIPLIVNPLGYFTLVYYDENNEEQINYPITNYGHRYIRPNTNLDVTYKFNVPNMLNKELYIYSEDVDGNLLTKLCTIKTTPLPV